MRTQVFSILGKLRELATEHLGIREISTTQLSADSANRLRKNQIQGAISQMRVFLAGNSFFAPVLSFQAWNAGVNHLVIAWTAATLVFSFWLFLRWNKSYLTTGSEADMQGFVNETKLNAALWCVGMVMFYPFVSGNEKAILCSVMVGSMALGTVGFSHAPKAAFWYLGIMASTMVVVAAGLGIYWGSASDIIISTLALVAGVAITNTTIERARAQIRAFINHESLSQKTEVVDLLLKDYEEQSVEWIWRTDPHGRILTCPQQIEDLISSGNGVDHSFALVDLIEDHIGSRKGVDLQKLKSAFGEKQDFHNVTLPLYSPSTDSIRWIMMRGRPQYEDGMFAGFRGIFADATSSIEAQKQVELLAKHDPLTGTFNRNHIQSLLENLDPLLDKSVAFLIDLDGFKQVNDSYGHAVGDLLLQHVANRLIEIIGKAGIVSRLGGDEFLVLTNPPSKYAYGHTDELSQRILSKISEPYLIEQYDISISASIGTSRFPNDTTNGPNLLNQADLALYAAKRGGRNKSEVFVQDMQVGLQRRIEVTNRLRLAIENDGIVPNYQPQYCADTKRLTGFEALARWTDAELGVVGPDIFIPIAEETGMIHTLGERLLYRACIDALSWKTPNDGPAPTVSVNVSPVQVMRGGVVKSVQSALLNSGLSPERLEIEVTEGVLIEDMRGTVDVLTTLSKLGVKIALDDFGTGYSSLSYLRALPLHRLKIDKSFIADIKDTEAQTVVKAIIDLCSGLDLDVIAEGVEHAEDVDILNHLGCDILQGYYFSHPLPASDIHDLIHKLDEVAA